MANRRQREAQLEARRLLEKAAAEGRLPESRALSDEVIFAGKEAAFATSDPRQQSEIRSAMVRMMNSAKEGYEQMRERSANNLVEAQVPDFINPSSRLSGGRIHQNMCTSQIAVLPEDSSYGGVKILAPGEIPDFPIDGIATKLYKNKVYKVPDFVSVEILPNGSIDYSLIRNFGLSGASAALKHEEIGWKDADFFISRGAYDMWEPLFDQASKL